MNIPDLTRERSRRLTALARLPLGIVLLATLAAVPGISPRAQDADPPPPTGTPGEAPTTETAGDQAEGAEVPTEPIGPDFTEVNESILEGDYDGALTLLDELAQEFPDDPGLLLMQGEVLLRLGKPQAAREALERSIELDADRERTHFQLATALVSLGESDAALQHFAREIELNEDARIRNMAHLNRYMLLAQARDWAQAAGELEAALVADPSQVQIYGDLYSIYLRAGDVAAASSTLDRGLEAGFRSAGHFYSLGARLYRDKQYEASVDAFRSALEIDAGLARAERSLAAALEQLGQTEESIDHLRRYLELAPDAEDAEQVAAKIREADGG